MVLNVVEKLVHERGLAVAAIDGPVHGNRRSQPAEPSIIRDEFRSLWDQGGSVEPMVADWKAALDALCRLEEIDRSAIGYFGVSMGTAYGIPLLANEPRIRAAVLGMWGTSRANSERLIVDAKNVRCPSMFIMQWDDPLFTRDGQFQLFDSLPGDDKQMRVYPGGHVEPQGETLTDATEFLARRLAA